MFGGHRKIMFVSPIAELLDNLRPVSPKPGHMERVKTPLNSNAPMDEDEPAYRERFLKINVRHITDGQVYFQL